MGGSGLIARNVIRNNGGSGINMYHFFGPIEENEICHNSGSGLVGVCCEEPTIQRNHIHHNSGNGISTSFYCYAYHNLIEHNGGAGISPYMSFRIEHNIIRGNSVGVMLPDHPLGSLHFNDIYDNTSYAIDHWWHDPDPWEVDATENWWGTADPDEIAAAIWDCHDDPSIGTCVVYDPWCTTPGCEPVAVEATSWGAIKAMYR